MAADSRPATLIAYFTDVEGRWDKLAGFCDGNPLVTLDRDALRVAEGAVFVFGGDAIDRGPASRRIVAALIDVKRRQPSQVVLLAGNRDINKMRLVRELAGHPPSKAPEGLARGALLRWIFANTMGAPRAFEYRAAEIGSTDDDAVVDSFLSDLRPDGPISEYLGLCQLGYRREETLFVHGAVTEESLGVVPGATRAIGDLDGWIAELNAFCARQVDAFRSGADPSRYSALIDYQRPIADTHINQASVVYGRLADDSGNPWLPAPEVMASLQRAGICRLVVGHTPSGDTPSLLRDPARGFELILADNSYSRLEVGTQLRIDGAGVAVRAVASLDGGARADVRFETRLDEDAAPIGLRDRTTGQLVKGRIGEAFLLYRGLPGHEVEQLSAAPDEVGRRALVAPHRA